MKTYCGDIWDLFDQGYSIVIPTNMGWNKYGKNVMGAGLAKQALERFPGIDSSLGFFYKNHQNYDAKQVSLIYTYCVNFIGQARYLIFLVTKPLNRAQPWLSWKADADPEVVKAQLRCFTTYPQINPTLQYACPLVGSGCGRLKKDSVIEMITEEFDKFDNFTLVLPESYANKQPTQHKPLTNTATIKRLASILRDKK